MKLDFTESETRTKYNSKACKKYWTIYARTEHLRNEKKNSKKYQTKTDNHSCHKITAKNKTGKMIYNMRGCTNIEYQITSLKPEFRVWLTELRVWKHNLSLNLGKSDSKHRFLDLKLSSRYITVLVKWTLA